MYMTKLSLDDSLVFYLLLVLPLAYPIYFHFYSILHCTFTHHRSKYSHFCYTHFLDMFLNWLTLKPIKHDRSYSRPIIFSFRLMCIRLSYNTPNALCYFNQPVFILFVTSSYISPLLCITISDTDIGLFV